MTAASTPHLRAVHRLAEVAARAADPGAILEAALDVLAATLNSVSDGITVQGPDGRLLFANAEAALMMGFGSPEELMAADLALIMERVELYDEEGRPLPLAELPGRRALLGEEPGERLVRYRFAGQAEDRWSLVSARPVRADDGSIRFAVNVVRDVTEMQRTFRALQETERRMEFLSETTRQLLDTSLDHAEVLQRLADLFVPALADMCTVREVTDDGSVRRAALRWSDGVDPRIGKLIEASPPVLPAELAADLRRGRSVLVEQVERRQLGDFATEGELPGLLEELRLGSAIAVPILSGGRVAGMVSLLALDDRRYGPADLAMVEEVGRRAGMALEHARLYERQSSIASTLQRALLPPSLPEVPGMEMAAEYHAAAGDIGGDFYDVIPLGPECWLVAVGDVCGKGIEAAASAAMVRHTLRALATGPVAPSVLLARVNDALLSQLGAERFCTLACALVDVSGEAARVTLALGGHPRPLLVAPGGDVRPVGVDGSFLGSLPHPQLADTVFELAPGEALVLFTDGCLGHNPTRSEEALAAALAEHAGGPAALLVRAVEAAAHRSLEEQTGDAVHHDDLTVLVCRFVPGLRLGA